MRYFTWGSGPPIVFIHGMADAAQAFVMVMHQLVEQHTCIAYELPDGTTDGSSLKKYSHDNYTDDLLELLDQLNLPSAAVLGSSFGSTIALASLSRKPERFTHGILQGSFAHRPLNFFQRYLCKIGRYWPGWIAEYPIVFRRVLRLIEKQTFATLPPKVTKFLIRNGGMTPFQAAAMRSLMFDSLDLRQFLPSIQTPVLMIGGDSDGLVPRQCEDEVERRLPSVKRVIFSGCGHYPHYTHPIPMAEAIQSFLDGAGNVHLLKSTGFGP
jgi:pimeloyl-ACP methyl ester carboxylesterase